MSGKDGGADRRTAQRIQTHHHVVFSEYRALGPLRTGTAVDRSSGGLRIITAHPEPLGTTIQIELRATADSPSVLLLEGRVVHLTPMDKGQCAMGIRLIHPALRAAAAVTPAREPRAWAARKPANLADVSGVSAEPIAMPSGVITALAGDVAAAADEAVTFRRIEDGGRVGSWAALFAILVLVVILLLLIMEAMRDERSRGALSLFDHQRVESVLTKLSPKDKALVEPQLKTAAPSTESSEIVDAFAPIRLNRQPVRLASYDRVAPVLGDDVARRETTNAMYVPRGAIDAPGAAPLSIGAYAAMLDYADRAAARGDEGLARAVVRRAMARAGTVPVAWKRLGEKFAHELAANSESSPPHLLDAEVSLDAAVTKGESPMKIEVDTGAHLLRVWRGSELVAEFPVGLGRDGATPRGDFLVGVKARDPEWRLDGRVVPGGAPDNPIGGEWMGLHQDGSRTGIGIHPTARRESIGADQSRGCVRMRPEDAETLYRLVPLGAAVTIHS